MSGFHRLRKSANKFYKAKVDEPVEIPGELGLKLGGSEVVNVPNRKGYVYVRLFSNQNEVVQALNEVVEPIYGLAVMVGREKNNKSRYHIIGRDTGRYQEWGTTSPYLINHHPSHEFGPYKIGSDIVWVYNRQFMPLLATPSGTAGTMGLIIHPTPMFLDSEWRVIGGTGTSSFSPYKPTGSSACMVLVYIDGDGNPQLLAGSPFSASLTGSVNVYPYVPDLPMDATSSVAAVRLVSGTSRVSWNELYDLRQFFGGSVGGILTEGIAVLLTTPAGVQTLFQPTSAGLSAALAAASAGDNVSLPPMTFVGDFSSSVSITLSGRSRNSSIIQGTFTGANETVIEDMAFDLTVSAGTESAITIHGNGTLFECAVFVSDSGGGTAYGLTVDAAGAVGIRNTFMAWEGGTGGYLLNPSHADASIKWRHGYAAGTRIRDVANNAKITTHSVEVDNPSYVFGVYGDSDRAKVDHTHSGSDLLIYDNSVFMVTGTSIDFGDNVTVSVTGSVAFISVDGVTGSAGAPGETGAPGDNTLLLYEDSAFKVTGTAINFTSNLNVVVSGSVAHISAVDTVGGGGGGSYPVIYDDNTFSATGTAIHFNDNLTVIVSGSSVWVDGSADNGVWVPGVYVGAWFDEDDGDALHVLTSPDGLDWTDLNVSYGTAVRDPSILYHNSLWWIAHTHSGPPTDEIPILKSTDLYSWSTGTILDTSEMGGDSPHAWSPEWFVDDDGSVYLFMATGDTGSHKIYETHPTDAAWTTWSDLAEITGTGFPADMIDPCVRKIGSTYYLWYKDDDTDHLCLATSSSPTSGYTEIHDGDWAGLGDDNEGESLTQIDSDTWRIYFNDTLTDGVYYSDSSDNFETWTTPAAVTDLASLSHGTAIQVSDFVAYQTIVRLDQWAEAIDNTDLNATTGHHGLLPKLSGFSDEVLLGDGTWGAYTTGVGSSATIMAGEVLLDETAAAGGQASFSVDSIGAYSFIEILLDGVSERDDVTDPVEIALNDDATDGNYRAVYLTADGSVSTGNEDTRRIGNISALQNAGSTGIIRATIHNPSGATLRKTILSTYVRRYSATASTANMRGVQWESTNAITKIALATDSGEDFAQGTRCLIVGYREITVGGPDELDDLTDVNAPSPTDGQVLTWDNAAGEWVADDLPPGLSGLGTLLLYEDDTFKVTGTAIHFRDSLDVIVSGSAIWVNSLAGGGGVGSYPVMYDDNVYKVTGSAISFNDGYSLSVTGSVVYVTPDPIGCRYYISSGTTQTLASTIEEVVNFATESYDTHNAVTTGEEWKFTAPETGIYFISSAVGLAAITNWAVGEAAVMFLYINGAKYCRLNRRDYQGSTSNAVSLVGSTDVWLAKGDYLQVYVRQDTGNDLSLDSNVAPNGLTCYISIHKVH